MYPDSDVALWGTGLDRYSASQQSYYSKADRFHSYPYGDYRTNHNFIIFPSTTNTPDLSVYLSKEIVLGICLGDELRAYAFRDMGPEAVINDDLGGEPLLVVFHEDSQTALPYSREIDGRTLTFYQVDPSGDLPEFRDVETGTTWDLLGRAVAGPHEASNSRSCRPTTRCGSPGAPTGRRAPVWQTGDGIIDAPEDTAVLEPEGGSVPRSFDLGQNYPNPFNPGTRIRFALPADGEASLTVYNAFGQRVRTLAEGRHRAGHYLVDWDGTDDSGRAVASGVYHYRLEMPARDLSRQRTMTLAR